MDGYYSTTIYPVLFFYRYKRLHSSYIDGNQLGSDAYLPFFQVLCRFYLLSVFRRRILVAPTTLCIPDGVRVFVLFFSSLMVTREIDSRAFRRPSIEDLNLNTSGPILNRMLRRVQVYVWSKG